MTRDPVIAGAAVMYAIEFVVDKIPYVDNTWDVIHTAIRPAIGGVLGVEFAGEMGGANEVLAGVGSGTTALASHAVKAGIRLGVNASPEPFSNIIISLAEDGAVAGVVALAITDPLLALIIAGTLLAIGITLVVLMAGLIRKAIRTRRDRAASKQSRQ